MTLISSPPVAAAPAAPATEPGSRSDAARAPRPAPVPAPAAEAPRDAAIDAVRAGALLAVVVLHALMVGAQTAPDGSILTSVALSGEPWFVPLTWAFQIMPLFFIAGGFASLAQWRRLRSGGGTASEYVMGRVRRLAVPAGIMTAVVGGAFLSALGAGAEERLVAEAALRVGQPLWFLAVYFVVTALVPAMAWAHERRPALVLAGLSAAVVAVDFTHTFCGVPVGFLNLLFVWALMQQLGFVMRDGGCARWSRPMLLAAAGVPLLLLVGLLTGGGRSADMLVNLNPPTLVLALWGVAQFFVLQLVRPALDRLLRTPRLARLVARANACAMSVYLWHMPVTLVLVLLLWSAGAPLPPPHSAAWWATRAPWLLAAAAGVGVVAPAAAALDRRLAGVLRAWSPLPAGSARQLRGSAVRSHGSGPRAVISVLCGVAGTATVLLVGVDAPVPYLAALSAFALAVTLSSPAPTGAATRRGSRRAPGRASRFSAGPLLPSAGRALRR